VIVNDARPLSDRPPPAILALFGDAREHEVVVNPNMLRGRLEVPGLDVWVAGRTSPVALQSSSDLRPIQAGNDAD
jgi:hypothetical protein